jgi:hypothetical protein
MPNQINRVEGDETNGCLLIQKYVNCLKRDSISVKTLRIVSLGISSYIGAHYLSNDLDTLVVFASNFDYYILIPFGKTYVFLFVKLAYLDYSLF